jgi:putative DNA-invertase from lambdoid prophage Rac
MKSPSTTAAFYARVSTNKQEYSLEAQLESAQRYVTYKNLTLSPQFTFQDSETSKKPLDQRPGGRQLLNLIQYQASIGDPITHLVITKLDRLDRTTALFLDTYKQLNDLGITLHITDCGGEHLTTSGIQGKLVLTILSAVAEWERETIRERTTNTMKHMRSKNLCTGSIPYGKTGLPIPGATTKSGQQQYNLIDNDAEIQAILLMQTLRAAGHSFKSIADHLNARAIPTKSAKAPWQCGNVAGVLQSKTTAEILQRFNPPDQAAA